MFKNIHIGQSIKLRVEEVCMPIHRICSFLECNENEVEKMYKQKSLDTDILLKWSKLLEYDFFRLYSQHLILYSPSNSLEYFKNNKNPSVLPQFRKNIYTKELVLFILELIDTGEKTKQQVMVDYRIPKTTLYKWIYKYRQNE